ncbi:hypothetical protein FGO68_gene5312 [Halteria grandinella]|uniref:Uncharacterized protein n=1 Tax=Halteria grandinella TaxID=5974 RepID=A0A8J8T418_HALGN|nr:hypothetical protein FGO68_gene5312 [Halteria grandinella]
MIKAKDSRPSILLHKCLQSQSAGQATFQNPYSQIITMLNRMNQRNLCFWHMNSLLQVELRFKVKRMCGREDQHEIKAKGCYRHARNNLTKGKEQLDWVRLQWVEELLISSINRYILSLLLGRKDESRSLLAALGLGTLMISVGLFSIVYTFNNSLLTLVSQSFGQKDQKLSATYLNRQIYLIIILYIPQSFLLYRYTETVFLNLGIDPAIASQGALYVRICLYGHLFLNISNCYQKYLSAQREVKMQMLANLVSLFSHTFLIYILVINRGMGIEGVALATSINYFLRFIILQVFIYFSRFNEHLIGMCRRRSRKHLLAQMRLGLKSVVMGIWQHWSYQMYSVIAIGLTHADVIAAQYICINIVSIFHVIPIALSMAFSVFIGNMIGSKRVADAKAYVKLGIITGLLWGVACGTIMIIFKQQMISFFSSSMEIVTIVEKAYGILVFYVFAEPLSKVITGIITGLGKQGQASIFTLIGYWVVGIPISITFILYHGDSALFGIWLGASVSIVFIFIFQYFIIQGTDYNEIVKEAELRRLRDQPTFSTLGNETLTDLRKQKDDLNQYQRLY